MLDDRSQALESVFILFETSIHATLVSVFRSPAEIFPDAAHLVRVVCDRPGMAGRRVSVRGPDHADLGQQRHHHTPIPNDGAGTWNNQSNSQLVERTTTNVMWNNADLNDDRGLRRGWRGGHP